MDNFEVKELGAKVGDKNIYGVAYVPNEAKKGKRLPAIIYSHGMSSNHESGDKYAREFAKRGYVVYCFDFRGGQDSKSDGDPLKMTIFTEQTDLEAAYDMVIGLPYTDANNIFLMGASMGGAVTALVAAKYATLIKGVILLYPAFSLPDDIMHEFPDPKQMPDTYDMRVTVGKGFLEMLWGFDFYSNITQYRGPVLLLHGTGDHVVPSGYSVKAVNAYSNAHLELIADAEHGFTGGYFKYAVRCIVDFLDEETDLADESGLSGDLNFGGGNGMAGMGGFPGLRK